MDSTDAYSDPTSFGITGTLTLDALGDSDVFWQVGSSATLGTGTDFAGSILAFESITLNTGATVEGRMLALNGAVTLDSNTIINVPEPDGALLVVTGLAFLFIFRRRSYPRINRLSKKAPCHSVPQSLKMASFFSSTTILTGKWMNAPGQIMECVSACGIRIFTASILFSPCMVGLHPMAESQAAS